MSLRSIDRSNVREAFLIRRSPTWICVLLMAATAACQDVSGPSTASDRPLLAGEVDSPFVLGDRRIAPANHLGPSKLEIVPAVSDNGNNVIPFGNNVLFGFTGFIYRNVPAFTLDVGDVIAFDLKFPNSVAVRRNIFFATANKNPAACVLNRSTLDVDPQGIAASSGWTMVVSENQVPQNPSGGDAVVGNFELRYVAETPFAFTGGGLIVGFQGSPPATFADDTRDLGSDGFLVHTDCEDPGGHIYARIISLPDLPTGTLDNPATSDGVVIGGIVIFGDGGPAPTCAEGVTAARTRIAQLFSSHPILRLVLNILLSRMQQSGFPNAETNFGLVLDFAEQQGIITSQDAAELKNLVSPC